MDGLGPNQLQGVHMNDIPIAEDRRVTIIIYVR